MRATNAEQKLVLFVLTAGLAACGRTTDDSSAMSSSDFTVSIVAVKKTYLKVNTAPSAQLNALEKCLLTEGTRLALRQSPALIHSMNGTHFKISLKPDNSESTRCKLTEGFVFTEHVLQDIRTHSVQTPKNDGDKNSVSTRESPAESTDNLHFIWPVYGGVVTSDFGPRFNTFHSGIDIDTAIGTDVLASAAGHISFLGWNRIGYGALVQIAHPEQFETLYGHNSSLHGLAKGKVVVQGDVIAKSGSTGLSGNPHVHFEIYLNGKAQDPLRYLPRRRTGQ